MMTYSTNFLSGYLHRNFQPLYHDMLTESKRVLPFFCAKNYMKLAAHFIYAATLLNIITWSFCTVYKYLKYLQIPREGKCNVFPSATYFHAMWPQLGSHSSSEIFSVIWRITHHFSTAVSADCSPSLWASVSHSYVSLKMEALAQ